MRIKTFHARTMAEALRDVKAELGPDALLLSTKEKPSRSGGETTVEVVAAIDTRDGTEFFREPAKAPRVGQANPAEVDGLTAHRTGPTQICTPRVKCAGSRRRPPPGAKGRAAARERCRVLYRDLVTAGVHAWLARRMVRQSVRMLDAPRRRHRAALLSALNALAGG